MSRYAHKTKTARKIITVQEWADYIHVSRQTMTAYIKSYQETHKYDPTDIYSILDFHNNIKVKFL